MYWLSGAESEKFVRSVEDALKKVISAGPNPLKLVDEETKVETKQVITTPVE